MRSMPPVGTVPGLNSGYLSRWAPGENPANMGTLAGVDENGELNQQVPGLGRGDDTDMPDGDLADKWLYLDGYGEKPCTIARS